MIHRTKNTTLWTKRGDFQRVDFEATFDCGVRRRFLLIIVFLLYRPLAGWALWSFLPRKESTIIWVFLG